MDQQQARWALFKISLVAVAATSWIFMSFIFATRPQEQTVTSADPLVSLVRLPASLPGMPSQIPKLLADEGHVSAPIRMDVFKLKCWDAANESEQAVESRWLRLTGRACQTDAGADAVEVRNLTNGYVGTVFAVRQDALTTDFIPLQEGRNEILFRINDRAGTSLENRFVFVKAAAE